MRGTRLIVIALLSTSLMLPTSTALASTLTSDAQNLRAQASQTMDTYLSRYGDRLTQAERTTLEGLSTTADSELAKVERAVARAERVSASRKAKKATALRTALRTHAAAKARAEKSLETAQTILQRRLSIFEALDALSDYESLMTSYNGLGTALEKQASALR